MGTARVFSTGKEVYNIGTPLAPYSTAVKANGFIFVSGQLGVDSSTGKFVSSEVEGQTEQTLNNLKGIIDGMGSELNKVCKTTVLFSDINDFAKVNVIYSKFFKDANVTELPARAAYAVANLPLNAKIEIEAIVME